MRPRPLLTLIAVALMAAGVVAERAHTYSEPLERDAAGYAVIAHEMRRGRLLYSDLWERKPPLLYATFGAAERAVGYGPNEVFLVNVAAALATLAAAAVAGAAAGPAAGIAAAALWAMVGGDLLAQANQPNAEVFVNACLATAFAVLARWPDRPGRRMVAVFAVGGLLVAATMYKQHAVVTAAALLVGHVAVPRPGSSARRRLSDAVVMAAIGVAAWSAQLGYFAAVGRWGDAVDALLWQNLSYAGGGGGGLVGNLVAAFRPANLFPVAMGWAIVPLALMAVAAVGWIARRWAVPPQALLWAFWAAGTGATVAAPGYFLAHYFQLWMPPLCVAGGWAVGALSRSRRAAVGRAVVAVALAAVAIRQGADYRLSPEQWARRGFADAPYFDNDFTRHRDVGRQLGVLLRPSETFWNLGEDNTLYFAAGRSPPVGMLYLDPVIVGPDTARHWSRLTAELERSAPDLIVVSLRTFRAIDPAAPVFPWMRHHYAAARTGDLGRPTYRLFVRRGTDLYRRLNGPATRAATRGGES